jgi:lysyl-tRNA synthetase
MTNLTERDIRIEKIAKLKKYWINPYAAKFEWKQNIKVVKEKVNKNSLKTYEELQNWEISESFRIAWRIIVKREHWKLSFAKLRDFTWDLQIALVKNQFKLYDPVTEKEIATIDSWDFWKKLVDLWDHIGVEGYLFITKHWELTLFVKKLYFLSKTVRPLPEKFHWLGDDKESRYRYRYLDLIVSDEQGEQRELEFLRKDEKFKRFLLDIFENYENHKDYIENVKKVINFRVKKLNEQIPQSVENFLKTWQIIDKDSFYNYIFDLFVKSNKVRDYMLSLMKDTLPAQYWAAKFRMNTKLRFIKRWEVIKFLRNYLEKQWFIEVETPVLQNKASWALAKPFITHHNAYDIDVYLRIAPETRLKRAIVWWFEKVYEFARCFRNEWVDPSHLQDFTMLEFYWTYVDYNFLMDFTEKMFKDLLKEVFGTLSLIILDREGNPVEIDFSKKWPRVTIFELIKPYFPELEDLWKKDELWEAKQLAKIKLKDHLTEEDIQEMMKLWWGNFIDFVYKKTARKKLIEPVFVINHPIELSPLARKNDKNPKVVDRFQLVVNWWEIVNAYSELIDPVDQMERFIEQAKAKAAWDEEAHEVDKDYVKAMEYWMPPIAWWGSGIDRLCALFMTQENIRDVVMFPLMKPEE